MQKLKLALVALLAFSVNQTNADSSALFRAGEMRNLWSTWKQVHNKSYNGAEEMTKFATFVENYIRVEEHNTKNQGGVKLALNKFADLSKEEFKEKHLNGLYYDKRHVQHLKKRAQIGDEDIFAGSKSDLPATVDWRTKGAVTNVKDQGQCGSCWAFSTTGALEGLNFIKSGQLLSFSEQQLVDCDHTGGDSGCGGGLMTNAFVYTAQKGIETEADYPYNAQDNTCKYQADKAHHVNTGHKSVTPNNADALKTALVTQPIAVAIEADENAFQFYTSGVITSGCGTDLDHGVLAVGYTTVSGTEAFIVKNSWGPDWGDNGYVMISTDKKANGGQGVCGILMDASFPTA